MVGDSIREISLKVASQLGYSISAKLPPMERVRSPKPADEVIERLLCLHAVAACSYGFDRREAIVWIEHEQLRGALTDSERRYLDGAQGDKTRFQIQVEGMWALAWALGLVPELNFGRSCDDSFVHMMPNLKEGQASAGLRKFAALRPLEEIVATSDLAYCIHWAIRQAELDHSKPPGTLPPYVVEERRRALEWLISDLTWEEVSLDT